VGCRSLEGVIPIFGYDAFGMHIFDEMKAYVGLTEDDDRRLRAFHARLDGHVPMVIDHFYECILRTPAARNVLQDDAQVTRLKVTLRVWLHELLQGPRDLEYYERRRRIGHRHVDVALPSRFMFTAMSVMYQDLCDIAMEFYAGDDLHPILRSLRRATDLDLAIMTGTYVEGRERRQLVSVQELVLTRLPIAAIIADNNGIVTSATGPASALMATKSIVGEHWRDAFPHTLTAAADLSVVVDEALANAAPRVLPRIRARIAGRRRFFRVTVVPLDHDQAKLLIHLEDLTDAIDAEARVQRSEALAQIGALSAAVAHELRNPLAGMSGAIQVISRSYDEDDSRKAILGKVDEQIGRLNHLVNELLTFARPSEPNLAAIDLLDIASSAAELVRASHPDLGVTVVGEGSAHADRTLAYQIALNLIQNAANAAGEDGRILVRVEGASLRVEDSGSGVPDELREKIFEPFFTTRTRGTGLGLAICIKAARSMNAELSLVDVETLGGAAFLLTFQPA